MPPHRCSYTRPASVHTQFVLLTFALLLASALALSSGRFQFTQPVYTTTEDFGVAYITVQRSLGIDGRAAVYVSTLLAGGGNAVAGRDFKPVFNRSLVWQDGDDLEKELYVPVFNDGKPQELPKTFTLYLHDANGAQINPERNVTQIVLAPPANLLPGSFRFLNATLEASEVIVAVDHPAESAFAIPVVWENGTTSTAQVKFEIVCESACGPDDFTVVSPANSLLQWTRDGPRVQNILLSIMDDNVYEQMESFRVRLKLVDAFADGPAMLGGVAAIGSIGEVIVRITGPNDVQAGSVQFQAECFPACPSKKYTVLDGGAVQVVLQRHNGTDGAASVTLRTADGTALANVDYKPVTTLVQWAEGDGQDKVVVMQALADVPRLSTKRFALELSDSHGAALSGSHASKSFIDIIGPSNIVVGEVNFAATEPLADVLRRPDESFLPLVTRLNSGLSKCPRLVVTKPGVVELLLQRSFANVVAPASVTLRTVDATATAGVDFKPLTPTDAVVEWKSGDADRKRVQLTIADLKQFYTDTRMFAVEIAAVSNVALGNCYRIEVLLQSVGEAPHIVSFDLNMNTRQLALTLSHPMLAATLDASKLQLQSESVVRPAGATAVFQLSRQSTTTVSGDGTQIVLDISTSEMHALKMVPLLAKSAAAVFLSAQPGLFQYVFENCVSPLSSECANRQLSGTAAPLPVTTFVADTTSPVLLGFSLDLAQQLLKLRFSEPVDHTNVHVNALALADNANGRNAYKLSAATRVFRPTPNPLAGTLLRDGNKLPMDGTYLTLLLDAVDGDALRALGNGQVGVQRASTFLSLARDFVTDIAVPPNPVAAIDGVLLQTTASDCSACPAGTFLAASCSDTKDRVCAACTVCPTNSYALAACTASQDTVCYPCTECHGSQYATVQCTPTTDRECASCTKCTRDEYEASPCINGVNRVCRTCDSCTLTKDQQRTCEVSFKWHRKVMKAPYACPLASQTYQTLEARLQRAKSNRCGAGRCSCSNSGVGNFNPNADSFPDDARCTEPAVYNIFL